SQKTNFPYEIIVGDDASTDGTVDVLKEFARENPGLVIPILHEKNIGPVANYFSVHRLARGEYVCHMDGDDLAFPEKLQKQVNVMEADKSISILWHRMKFFNSLN